MTDQTIPDLPPEDVAAARDWALHVLSRPHDYLPMENAAARVILHAVPAPTRPTLADMTWEERRAQFGATAELGDRLVIISEMTADHVRVVAEDFSFRWHNLDSVTPRPDLPRFAWPGEQQPAPAPALPEGWRLADHPRYGRVIVTTPEPDGDGEVYFVFRDDELSQRHDLHWCKPAELTYIDTPTPAPVVGVPPNTLDVGSVWSDADALARACDASKRDQIVVTDCDGDVFVWAYDAEGWEVGTPTTAFAPYTIIHAGQEWSD